MKNKTKLKELKTVEANCQGNCPNCGSYNLDYQGLETEGTMTWYPFTCDDCKAVGSEDYDMAYLKSEVDVEVEE